MTHIGRSRTHYDRVVVVVSSFAPIAISIARAPRSRRSRGRAMRGPRLARGCGCGCDWYCMRIRAYACDDGPTPGVGERRVKNVCRSRSRSISICRDRYRSIVSIYRSYRYIDRSYRSIPISTRLTRTRDSHPKKRAARGVITRTLRHRNVRHHPSLRASRQDRRRLHRQGHQRQVHDGLEAARQQVRIRIRRDTRRERDGIGFGLLATTGPDDDGITDRDRGNRGASRACAR